MADYNLRLLTTLRDTDYIKLNDSDGIQFGMFKSNAFNSNGSVFSINGGLQSDSSQTWTFASGGLNVTTPTYGSILGTLGGIKFTNANYSGSVAIGSYYNVGIINAPSVLTITSPTISLGTAYGSIMSIIDINGIFIGGSSTAPSARLHVKGDGTNPIALFQDNNSITYATINYFGSYRGIQINSQNDDVGLGFANGGSDRFLIQQNSAQLKFSALNSAASGGFSFSGANTSLNPDGRNNACFINITTPTINYSASANNYRPLGIFYTINNSGAQTGTATGIFLNATETALNGMTHNLMDLQVGGVSKFKVDNFGQILLALNAGLKIGTARFVTNNGSLYVGDVDNNTLSKVIYRSLGIDSLIMNGAILQLSGSTSAFPAIKRNGAAIDFRLADDSGYAAINTGTITATGNVTAGTFFGQSYQPGLSFIKNDGTASFGTDTINASAVLTLNSTTKGFLPPRMTTAQKNAISTPATGLVVFDTDLGKLCVFSTTWQTITSA